MKSYREKAGVLLLLLAMMALTISMASASEVVTDRLNFYDSENHVVTVTNTQGAGGASSSTMPAGFSFSSSVDGCTNPSGQTVTCTGIADDASASFTITSPAGGTEYALYVLNTTINGTAANNVSFINIRPDEIFYTLIEYGRGRGNYFYNSMGTATSAGTGTGYPYVPNGTGFELNYLHKIFNIKQYYSLANSDATDVSFTCTYPYHTVVRNHLTTSISNDGTDWTVAYGISKIEGSWERMGFLGMDFDTGEYDVGDNFTVNCTALNYSLSDAYGSIVVDEDSFDLQVRARDALGMSASSDVATIGNGTSEVLVTYTFTNNEVYPVDDLMIEIQAPEKAVFIGVRGELWGSSVDKYTYELPNLGAGETATLALVARFDTFTGSDTSLLLTRGVKARYIPTWQLNSYNPLHYLQTISLADTQTVNYGISSEIINLQAQITRIENNTVTINNTLSVFSVLLNEINTTTNTINSNLLSINASLSSDISDLSTQITTFESNVQQLVNCTANPSAPLCSQLSSLNSSVANIQADLLSINSSLSGDISSLNSSLLSELNTQFTNVANNFTYTNSLITSMNTTLYNEVNTLEEDLDDVLVNLTSISNEISAVNTSLYNAINSINSSIQFGDDFAEVLTELDYMQGFNEELIFLVTDSVGLAQASEKSFLEGDAAMAKAQLEEASELLVEVQRLADKEEEKASNTYSMKTSAGVSKLMYWIKGLFM